MLQSAQVGKERRAQLGIIQQIGITRYATPARTICSLALLDNTAGGAGNTTANNNISGYGGHKIVFEATGSDHSFTITGNGFTLFDFTGASPVFPQIDNESSVLQTFNLTSGQAIAFNDRSASHKAEILANGGDITFSSTTGVDLAGTTQLQINSIAGKTVTFGGVISSSGNSGGNSFALNGNNNVIFAAANTYAGNIFC